MSLDISVRKLGDGENVVEAFKQGIKVSWLYLLDLKLHYGSSVIHASGVGGVYTPREFRGLGYSASTLNYAIHYVKELGYPLSALFGIQEYYHRFGFATFMGEHTVTIHLRNASRIRGGRFEVEVSEDSAFQSMRIADIYERINAAWPGAKVRSPGDWKGFRKGVAWEHSAKPLVIKSSGEVVAYAAIERWPSPEEFLVAEIGALDHDPRLYRALLQSFYSIALEEKKSHLTVHVPPDHPFADVAKAYGATLTSSYSWSGGGMARVTSLKKVLEQIIPELEHRSKGTNGDFTLEVESEAVTIRVRNESVKVEEGSLSTNLVRLGPGDAAQLIFGYRNPFELLSSVETRGQVGLCATLFPKSTPYVWQPDRW
ncbi:MAG: GNAT family N-acetyltransferase [Thermofilaceae archaeon]